MTKQKLGYELIKNNILENERLEVLNTVNEMYDDGATSHEIQMFLYKRFESCLDKTQELRHPKIED